MAIPVTSVSRRQEKLLKTAAAVYVITQEDIRRSGATDIADVLRMVPGMNVAQISSSKWAVGARGFNAQWENKLLVTVDGKGDLARRHRVGPASFARRGQPELPLPAQLPEQIVAFPENGEDRSAAQ